MGLDGKTMARYAAALGLVTMLAGTALVARAASGGTLGSYTGKVVNLREAPPSGLDVTGTLDWVKENKVTGRAQSAEGEWTLHVFTVFKSKPGMPKILLLFYDKADPESIKKREPTEVLEIMAPPAGTIFTTSVTVSEASGFNADHRYVMRFVAATSKTERLLSEGEIALVRKAPGAD